MNKKSAIMIGVMSVVLLTAVGLTVYIVRQQQDVRSRAQTTNSAQPTATTAPTVTTTTTVAPTVTESISPTSSACARPAQVTNVKITYPHCQ